MSNVAKIVVCGKLTDPLLTGSKPVGKCMFCNTQLQATALGRARLAQGYEAICNRCGLIFLQQSQAMGKTIDATLSEEVKTEIIRRLKTQDEGN